MIAVDSEKALRVAPDGEAVVAIVMWAAEVAAILTFRQFDSDNRFARQMCSAMLAPRSQSSVLLPAYPDELIGSYLYWRLETISTRRARNAPFNLSVTFSQGGEAKLVDHIRCNGHCRPGGTITVGLLELVARSDDGLTRGSSAGSGQ